MKKISVFIIFVMVVASSCSAIKQKQAANHQPFKPHQDKPMKQKRHR